jgi:hypothetical protein
MYLASFIGAIHKLTALRDVEPLNVVVISLQYPSYLRENGFGPTMVESYVTWVGEVEMLQVMGIA